MVASGLGRHEREVILAGAAAAYLAAPFARWPGGITAALFISSIVFWPTAAMLPRRWRDEIPVADILKVGLIQLSGFVGIFMAAYRMNQDWDFSPAATLGVFGIVHIVALYFVVGPSMIDVKRMSPLVVGSVWGITGVLSELDRPLLGETTYVLSAYGFIAAHVVHALADGMTRAAANVHCEAEA